MDGFSGVLLPWCLAGPAHPTEAAHRAWLALGLLAWILVWAVTTASPTVHTDGVWIFFAGWSCGGALGMLANHKIWLVLDGLGDGSAETGAKCTQRSSYAVVP